MPGASSTSVVSAAAATSISDWPTPTVSIRTTSQPAASRTRSACGVVARQPAEVAARGHRADEHALVGGVLLHPDAVAEQRPAGERRRGIDGEDARPAGRARAARRSSAAVVVDLPTPGDPVMPMTLARPDVGRERRASARGTSGEPSSISEISRAMSRARPSRAPSTSVGTSRLTVGSRPPYACGTRMSRASPCPPPPHSAAAPMPPPRRFSSSARCSTMPGARHADRVAEGDGAAVDVDDVVARRRAHAWTRCRRPRRPR